MLRTAVPERIVCRWVGAYWHHEDGQGGELMTRVTNVTKEDLLTRREAILQRHGVSLDEFAERAKQYALTGDEWADWDELQGIAFLLHDG